MKTLFLLLILTVSLYANHINWMGDYSKALSLAKKDNRVLMVLLVKQNCDSCRDTVAKIFTNQPYIDILNKKTVSVIVTKESKIAYPIELLYSTHFPTLFLINSLDEVFITEPIHGIITQEDMKHLAKFLNSNNQF